MICGQCKNYYCNVCYKNNLEEHVDCLDKACKEFGDFNPSHYLTLKKEVKK